MKTVTFDPAQWQLVPKEPTKPATMLKGYWEIALRGYKTVLSAAPQPPEVDQWLPPIERDEQMDRTYIPMPGGWEIQTKGKGSTFRICNTKAHERWPVLDETLHRHLEQMALDARASVLGQITPNPEGV